MLGQLRGCERCLMLKASAGEGADDRRADPVLSVPSWPAKGGPARSSEIAGICWTLRSTKIWTIEGASSSFIAPLNFC